MYQYPKQILTIAQQVQSYIDAGMVITSRADVEKALKSIGFYRLRGYSFHLYDNATKKYVPGTKFEDILKLYQFDQELSSLIFSIISKSEVALRVRLVESLLIHGDPLVLQDSSIFKEKKLYWQNMSTVASEIARSNDVFIKHNFDNHDGEVPVWAAVEVLSFGTLSKIIKNLKTGTGSSYSILAANYQYKSKKGNMVNPSQKMLASWILGVSVLRNMCAHNWFFRNYPFQLFNNISFAANNSLPQRPYMVRFIIFNLLFVPSTKPFDKGLDTAFSTADKSFSSPEAKRESSFKSLFLYFSINRYKHGMFFF